MTDSLLPGEQPQGEGQLPDLAVLNALCSERELLSALPGDVGVGRAAGG